MILVIALAGRKTLAQTNPDSTKKKTWPVNNFEPSFPGGLEKFQAFIKAHLRHIKGAAGKKVIVLFVVEEDGTVDNISAGRGISPEADKEAIRVIGLSPKWRPATKNGIARKMTYAVPVTFN